MTKKTSTPKWNNLLFMFGILCKELMLNKVS